MKFTRFLQFVLIIFWQNGTGPALPDCTVRLKSVLSSASHKSTSSKVTSLRWKVSRRPPVGSLLPNQHVSISSPLENLSKDQSSRCHSVLYIRTKIWFPSSGFDKVGPWGSEDLAERRTLSKSFPFPKLFLRLWRDRVCQCCAWYKCSYKTITCDSVITGN